MDLWIGSPANEKEIDETLKMTARAFRGRATAARVRAFRRDHERPGFRPELHRILKVDGRIVAGALVVDKELHIGKAVLRCGGIGDVATDPKCRRRGLGRRIMNHCAEWMTEQGYDVSLLFGIVDYYHKFGYRPTGCDAAVSLSVADAGHADRSALSPRAARSADLPAVARMHAQADKLLPMSFVRDSVYWDYLWRRTFMHSGRVLCDAKGNLAAAWYGETSDGVCHVGQVVTKPTAPVMSALLGDCARAATRAKAETIRVYASHDHPFAQHCREYGAEFTKRYHRNSGCMLRILDLKSTLAKLEPELNARLASPDAAIKTPPRLRIATDIGDLDLRFSHGEARVSKPSRGKTPCVRMDQGRLSQLLSGYRGIDDIARQPDVVVPSGTVPLLRRLFPEGCPFIWQGDRF